MSWELELRQVAVGNARIQNKLLALIRGLSKERQIKVVQRLMNDAYSPDCLTDSFVQELLLYVGNTAQEGVGREKPTESGKIQLPIAYLDLTKHRGNVGLHINVNVIGQASGVVYGSSIYSDDSDINTAAVHAGVVKIGESKVVTVVTKGPQKRCATKSAPCAVLHFHNYLQIYGIHKKRRENAVFQRMAWKFQI